MQFKILIEAYWTQTALLMNLLDISILFIGVVHIPMCFFVLSVSLFYNGSKINETALQVLEFE